MQWSKITVFASENGNIQVKKKCLKVGLDVLSYVPPLPLFHDVLKS